MQAFNIEVKWVPGKLHLIADALPRAPHFSPYAEELTFEITFAVLNEEHPQCNHIMPNFTCLSRIQGFTHPNTGRFFFKRHGPICCKLQKIRRQTVYVQIQRFRICLT